MKATHGWLGALALAAGAGWTAMTVSSVPGPVPVPMPTAGGALLTGVAVQPVPLPTPQVVPAARAYAPPPARPAPAPRSVPELDRLVAAARQGDVRAGYAAYQALAACAAADGAPCAGVPAPLLQERLRFLADAAHAGLPAAQIDVYMEGPDPLQAQDPDALQAWRQQALAGLTSAASQCEPFAAGLLATLYDAGELTPRNAAQAVAYAVAEGQLRRRPPSDAALRDRLAEPIDDAALLAARQQGMAWAAACR